MTSTESLQVEQQQTSETLQFHEDAEVNSAAILAIGSEITVVNKRFADLSAEDQIALMKTDPHVLAMRRMDGLSRLNETTITQYGTEGYKIGDGDNNVRVHDDQGNSVRVLSITGVEKSGDDVIFTCTVEGSNSVIKRNKKEILNAHLIGNKDVIATAPPFSEAEVRVLNAHIAAINPELTDEQKINAQIPADDRDSILATAQEKTDARKSSTAETKSTPEEELLRNANAMLSQELSAVEKEISDWQARRARITGEDPDENVDIENEKIAKLSERRQQLAVALEIEGEVGVAFKRWALASLKANPEAITLAEKLVPASEAAEKKIDDIFSEYGISEEKRAEMQDKLKHGDFQGILQAVQSLEKPEDAMKAMERLFGDNLTDPKKVEALLDKAGYTEDQKNKIKEILAAGGLGVLGLIALLVMGPLAASMKVFEGSLRS